MKKHNDFETNTNLLETEDDIQSNNQSPNAPFKKFSDFLEEINIPVELPENNPGQFLEPVQFEKKLLEIIQKGIMLWTKHSILYARAAKGVLTTDVRNTLQELSRRIIDRIGEWKYLPLGMSQKRYLLLSLLQGNKTAYNIPVSITFKGTLNLDVLKQSLLLLVNRYDIFRTIFPNLDKTPIQAIRSVQDELPITITDLSPIRDRKQIENKLLKIIKDECITPLNLVRGPNLRMQLVILDEKETVLLFNIHHTLFDGFSFVPLADELIKAYETLRTNIPQNEEKTATHADYVLMESIRLSKVEKDRKYWQETLKEAPGYIQLPLDFKRPDMNSFAGDSKLVLISQAKLKKFYELIASQGGTLFSGLFAIFDILIGKWTGEQDLIVGSVVQNKEKRLFKNSLGDFTNFVPIRLKMDLKSTWVDTTKQLSKLILNALMHRAFPFDKMVEFVPMRISNYNPIYNILVNFLPIQVLLRVNDELKLIVENKRIYNKSSMMDLRVDWYEVAEGLKMVCEYNTDLFLESTIDQLLDNFEYILDQILQDPLKKIEHFLLKPIGTKILPEHKVKLLDIRSPHQTPLSGNNPNSLGLLKKIFAGVIDCSPDQLDIYQNFFEMGGSSMKAVQLLNEFETHKLNIVISDIFKYPTISLLAGFLQQAANEKNLADTPVPENVPYKEQKGLPNNHPILPRKVDVAKKTSPIYSPGNRPLANQLAKDPAQNEQRGLTRAMRLYYLRQLRSK